MSVFGSGLKKLQLTGYKDNDLSSKVGSFSLPINPKSFNHSYSISLKDVDAIGKGGAAVQFDNVKAEKVTLKEVYIDTTGAIPLPDESKGKTVDQLITELKGAIYNYEGSSHAPPVVVLLWGTFSFKCFLDQFSVDYQMFQPDGTPLRAKLDMTFKGFYAPSEESSASNRQSPDVTHIVTVKYGDSLPLLCQQIYKNASYYLKIAEVNNLTNIRHLEPGTKLHFPPIK